MAGALRASSFFPSPKHQGKGDLSFPTICTRPAGVMNCAMDAAPTKQSNGAAKNQGAVRRASRG